MKTSTLQQLKSIAVNVKNSSVRIYICIVPEEEQRRFYISLYSRIFSWGKIHTHLLNKSDSFLLQLPLLFNKEDVLHLEFIENVSPSAKPQLYAFIQQYPSPLIISGTSYGHCMDLYTKYKEISLLIDLTRETKWDKKNRLKEYCCFETEEAGKSITPDAIEYLLSERGDNIVALQTELQKLICNAGTNPVLQKADISSIVSVQSHDDWKIREQIAFGLGTKYILPYSPKDFFQFLQQVRYLVDLAFFFLCAQENPDRMDILQKRFPHLKGSLFSHYKDLLTGLSIQYCVRAKEILFETEFTAKSSAIPAAVLTSYLIGKLQCLRKILG